MNTKELFEWAEEHGFSPEKQVKFLLESDRCDHGHDIEFVDSEEKAEIITAHNIESFKKGMRYAIKGVSARHTSWKEEMR
jgi:hypothetical protein